MPRTVIIRHRKENLGKCSLRGLESHEDFLFYSYPLKVNFEIEIEKPILLSFDGPSLTAADQSSTLVILDGTWKYVEKMQKNIVWPTSIQHRSLPQEFRTAYPRSQNACPYPELGLASIEAIFIAHLILKKSTQGLLDDYYWKNRFLEINNFYDYVA